MLLYYLLFLHLKKKNVSIREKKEYSKLRKRRGERDVEQQDCV